MLSVVPFVGGSNIHVEARKDRLKGPHTRLRLQIPLGERGTHHHSYSGPRVRFLLFKLSFSFKRAIFKVRRSQKVLERWKGTNAAGFYPVSFEIRENGRYEASSAQSLRRKLRKGLLSSRTRTGKLDQRA